MLVLTGQCYFPPSSGKSSFLITLSESPTQVVLVGLPIMGPPPPDYRDGRVI